jgi:hypothetical protein
MGIRVTSTVVEIVTKDLARALDFYRLLAWPSRTIRTAPLSRWNFPAATGWHSTRRRSSPACTPDGRHRHRRAAGTGFRSGKLVRGGRLFEKLTAAGHPGTLKPFDAPRGQRYATVTDPDGTSIDPFAALP